MNLEMMFISGRFFDCDLPKEKEYLLKYFKSDIQIQYLRYYFTFGDDVGKFQERTGHTCSRRWVEILRKQVKKVEALYDEAKRDMDLETLAKIKMGILKGVNDK